MRQTFAEAEQTKEGEQRKSTLTRKAAIAYLRNKNIMLLKVRYLTVPKKYSFMRCFILPLVAGQASVLPSHYTASTSAVSGQAATPYLHLLKMMAPRAARDLLLAWHDVMAAAQLMSSGSCTCITR